MPVINSRKTSKRGKPESIEERIMYRAKDYAAPAIEQIRKTIVEMIEYEVGEIHHEEIILLNKLMGHLQDRLIAKNVERVINKLMMKDGKGLA